MTRKSARILELWAALRDARARVVYLDTTRHAGRRIRLRRRAAPMTCEKCDPEWWERLESPPESAHLRVGHAGDLAPQLVGLALGRRGGFLGCQLRPLLNVTDGRSERWKDADGRCAAAHRNSEPMAQADLTIIEEEQAAFDASEEGRVAT